MNIPGQILSISNAPALKRRVKELEALVIGLKWQNDQLTRENLVLKDQINHFKGLILKEGKERAKLSRERTKIRKRKGWKPPEEREQP